MNGEFYRLYRADTIDFAGSIVIKLDAISDAINKGLIERGYKVDYNNPRSFKYYKHIMGEYHESDTVMTVRSSDTLEYIVFNKENLKVHLTTARVYSWGTDDYKQLCRLYPDQIDLINGILSPVSFEKAYYADDGTIINYSSDYVEEQEYDLIHKLQRWVSIYLERWNNPSYSITDELYLPAFIRTLYTLLPSVIANIRLGNCRTERVHSFHLREYLRSNGRLDSYLPYLNTAQRLWLYRNIRYLVRNAGKQSIFDTLVQHLLTDRSIPVSAYTINQDYSKMPDNILPDVAMVKQPLNSIASVISRTSDSVAHIVAKERTDAPGNAKVEEECIEKVTTGMQYASFSTTPSKVLESEAVDHSDSGVALLSNTLLTHWIYMGYKNLYTGAVTVNHPSTGERISLTARDAIVLCYYCKALTMGVKLKALPKIELSFAQKNTIPSLSKLKEYVDARYVTEYQLLQLQSLITPYYDIVSTEVFYDTVLTIHNSIKKSWAYVTSFEGMFETVDLKQARNLFYEKILCDFTEGNKDYDTWLIEHGINVTSLNEFDAQTLAEDLLKTATGTDLQKSISFSILQEQMLQLMQKLCSYSVQFLQTISFSDFYTVGPTTPRVASHLIKHRAEDIHVTVPVGEVQKLTTRTRINTKGVNVISGLYANKVGKSKRVMSVPTAGAISYQHRPRHVAMNIKLPAIMINEATVTRNMSRRSSPSDTDTLRAHYNDYGPGPSTLLYGNVNAGYFGVTSGSRDLSVRSVLDAIPSTLGIPTQDDIQWYKFSLDGEVVYMPSNALYTDISLKEAVANNLLSGKEIVIDGKTYLMRAPSLAPNGNATYRYMLDRTGKSYVSVGSLTYSPNGYLSNELTNTLLTIASDVRDDIIESVPHEVSDNLPTLKQLNIPGAGGRITKDSVMFVGCDNATVVHQYPKVEQRSDESEKAFSACGFYHNDDLNLITNAHFIGSNEAEQYTHLQYRPMLILKR